MLDFKEIVFYVLLSYLTCFLFYVSLIDYGYRSFSLKITAMHYPMLILMGWLRGQSFVSILVGFLSLFLLFYTTQLLLGSADKIVVGGLDIVICPLFTTLFGFGSIMYITFFFIVYLLIASSGFLSKPLKGRFYEEMPDRIPLVPVMFIPYILLTVLVF